MTEREAAVVSRRAEVEYVTRNFSSLQGLRLLPLAIVFAVWGASEAQLLTGLLWWALFATSLVTAAVATPLIGRWYRRQFGSVEPRRAAGHSVRAAAAVIGVVLAAVAVLTLGVSGRLPEVDGVALAGIVLGAALMVLAWMQGPVARRVHPWVHRFGAALAVVSVLPLGLVTGGGPHPLNGPGAMVMVIAGFFVVSAVDTHRALGVLLPGRRGAA